MSVKATSLSWVRNNVVASTCWPMVGGTKREGPILGWVSKSWLKQKLCFKGRNAVRFLKKNLRLVFELAEKCTSRVKADASRRSELTRCLPYYWISEHVACNYKEKGMEDAKFQNACVRKKCQNLCHCFGGWHPRQCPVREFLFLLESYKNSDFPSEHVRRCAYLLHLIDTCNLISY